MIDASNISGHEYAEYLRPLIEPLKRISEINAEKAKIEKRFGWAMKNAKDAMAYILGGGAIGVGIVIAIGFLLIAVKSDSSIVGALLVPFAGAGIGIGYFYGKKHLIPKKVEKVKGQFQPLIDEKKNQIDQTFSSIAADLEKYVPQTYWYYHAVATIHGYLMDGRANNWKEAVNLYETVKHQQKLEKQAEMQSEYAAITAANSRRTAAATTATAINTFFR